ncbi:hypothetical protein VP01_14224g1 [Puccinia sorghi]|uniref:Uncharacterized protein n=1 Tax=Puccinia sorghi TaxID=27349 RepID=A0A0L6VKQ8_9BASI|nr:hypothetical protein VP01_14224g1 [Puccinia sorghi]
MLSGEVEQVLEETPSLHLDTVSCPLGYTKMGIGDCQVWVMIDSGSMAKIELRRIVGDEYKVDGVVEGEWVEVANCKRRCGAYIGKGVTAGLSGCCR